MESVLFSSPVYNTLEKGYPVDTKRTFQVLSLGDSGVGNSDNA